VCARTEARATSEARPESTLLVKADGRGSKDGLAPTPIDQSGACEMNSTFLVGAGTVVLGLRDQCPSGEGGVLSRRSVIRNLPWLRSVNFTVTWRLSLPSLGCYAISNGAALN
jgi:hypothetical protein